jgi:hypothetical protein
MQDLNNEMDDLFRKAVEFYPLRPCPSEWEYLATRIRVKKRRFLFIPMMLLRKNLRLPIFLGIMLMIPAVIISLTSLYSKRSAIYEPANRAVISDIPETESKKKSNKTFVPMRIQIPSAMIYKNAMREKKYSVNDNPILLFAGHQKPFAATLTSMTLSLSDILFPDLLEANYKYARVQALNNEDRWTPEVNAVYMSVPLKSNLGLEWRSPAAERQNLTLHHLTTPRRQGFYLGFISGPLFSKIKNQGMTKPGFDFGILMGYAFSNNVSIETGIIRTRQYFTATGGYLQEILNMGGVKTLEGNRNAFSIPLKLKYNVINGPSGDFFFTAGVSSIVGVNDNIVITVDYLPIPPTNKIDLGPPSYLPAYMNFSIGYEYKIGRFANIRIEPYLEIPTNSTAGNSFKTHEPDHYVHVFNSGIHIAFSQFVH